MITYEEALKAILEHSLPLGVERAALDEMCGAVLAEPLIAATDLPSFDNSAVDGYGILVSDVETASPESPASLALIGTIQAGDPGSVEVKRGSTVKILTGAVVPAGVEAVVMREFCDEVDGTVSVRQSARLGENIRRRGEEFRAGDQVIGAGTRVTPSVVSLAATLGYSSCPVYQRPTLAVVATGNELVAPGTALKPGQIYDSNSYGLIAAARSLGVATCLKFHATDDAESTRAALTLALDSADVVVSAGGVSVGDYDFVKDVAEAIGVHTVFWRIALKPGKPVYFGILSHPPGRKKLVFGLPGNPVSALVTFHQLVKPALLKVMGSATSAPLLRKARLTGTVRHKPGRLEFVRGVLGSDSAGNLTVKPTAGQDSHMMGGLATANCLIYFPLDVSVLNDGDEVVVEMLTWS